MTNEWPVVWCEEKAGKARLGGHQQPFQKGHVGFHHTKKTVTEPQNCQEGFVWCVTCSKQFLLIKGVLLGH